MNDTKLRKRLSRIIERCNTKDETSVYYGCTVDRNFRNFEVFKNWYYKQVGCDQESWHIDKDILVKGNKVYSEETCCLVPREVNLFFTKAERIRGDYPIGVYYNKTSGTFKASISIDGKNKSLGSFDNEWSAFIAYRNAKEEKAVDLAKKWEGRIEHSVYEALMSYKVLLTD